MATSKPGSLRDKVTSPASTRQTPRKLASPDRRLPSKPTTNLRTKTTITLTSPTATTSPSSTVVKCHNSSPGATPSPSSTSGRRQTPSSSSTTIKCQPMARISIDNKPLSPSRKPISSPKSPVPRTNLSRTGLQKNVVKGGGMKTGNNARSKSLDTAVVSSSDSSEAVIVSVIKNHEEEEPEHAVAEEIEVHTDDVDSAVSDHMQAETEAVTHEEEVNVEAMPVEESAKEAEEPPTPKEEKKEVGQRSNDVIEEAKSKFLEKRKNRVLALVGAFETVMALQEPGPLEVQQQAHHHHQRK